MGKQKLSIVPKGDRLERAEFCTKYLENFECTCRNWVDLAVVLLEVEQQELFTEVGAKTWDEWAKQHAPVSYRLCYMIKARYKALKESFTTDELKLIPPETAQWASKAKNISPASLSKPEVKEALMLPRQKAVKVLKEALPDEHIEDVHRFTCKFAGSQHKVIQDGYGVFKLTKDESASFEEFLEFCVSEWVLSVGAGVS
jgi:hypothetical protein